MANTALQRVTQAVLTNKSGGAVAQGDAVVMDPSNAAAFNTTTTAGYLTGVVGVVLEPNGIASNAAGMVAFAGPVPKVNLSSSASLGDLFKTSATPKQCDRHAAGIVAGDIGIVMGTGSSPAALLWGLPAGATGAGSGNFSGPGASVAHNLVSFADTTGLLGEDSGVGKDGWITAETWTYVSADGPTGVFSVGSDVTTKYEIGMRTKYTQSAAVKYGIITNVGAFAGGNTPITIYGGTDYTLANAAITATYFSTMKAPYGFNVDPAKWTESLISTTQRLQNTPVASTWYNAESLSIPIGVWNVEYECNLRAQKSAATSIDAETTLSTANNSETDKKNSAYYVTGGASGTLIVQAQVHKRLPLTLTAKTTYYLNMNTGTASASSVQLAGDPTTFIRAISALL